jgi:hypothetical protein
MFAENREPVARAVAIGSVGIEPLGTGSQRS